MDVHVLGPAVPAEASSAPIKPEPAASNWDFGSIASVLSALLETAVSLTHAREKASGLGLTHYQLSDNRAPLSAKGFSRLLLAGYCLPAQVEVATARMIKKHQGKGRRVFLNLAENLGESSLIRSDLLLEAFSAVRCDFRGSVVVAASSWGELAGPKSFFFSGCRDAVDCYHWATAECDTDANGRILRCW